MIYRNTEHFWSPKQWLTLSLVVLQSVSFFSLDTRAQDFNDLDDLIDEELAAVYAGDKAKTRFADSTQLSGEQKNTSGSANIQISIQANPTNQLHSSGSKLQNSQEQSAEAENDNKNLTTAHAASLEAKDSKVASPSPVVDHLLYKPVSAGDTNLRLKRQEVEKENELRALEVLEQDRIATERKRAQKINRVFQDSSAEEVQAEKVSTERSVELERQAIKEQIKSEIAQELRQEAEQEHALTGSPEISSFVTVLAGMGDYPDVANVRGNYSLGVSFSRRLRPQLISDFGFLFSEFDVEQRDGGWYWDPYAGWILYPRITKMNQYQFFISTRYSPFEGVFQPYLGALAAYSFRTFSDVQFALPNNDAQSHAVDVGLLAGLSLELSADIRIGFDMRYLTNLTYRAINSGLQRSFSRSVYGSDTPIESLAYTQLSLTGEFRF